MDIALVEDNAADAERLRNLLERYAVMHQLEMNCRCFSGGDAFLLSYQPYRYTLIFLDIYMDGITGTETAERVRAVDDDVLLIFLTTSEEHRSEAFSLFASAYLVKPCAEADVFRALDHVLHLSTAAGKRFAFSFDRREYSLPFQDIVSLTTDGNYLEVTSRRGAVYRTRMTASAAVEALDGRFLALMKGVIVNLDYVLQIADGKCQLRGGTFLPVNVRKQKELQQRMLNYKFARIRAASLGAEGRP